MHDWKQQRKIVTLPIHGSSSPEVVLERTLEKVRAGHVKQVLVCIVWDSNVDGDDELAWDCDWSDGKLRDLLVAVKAAEISCEEQIRACFGTGSHEPPDAAS